jgi:hypothetical protein
MDTLHRPDIFERIIEVDQQARKALVNAIWIPRVATVAYKENQFGWPATVKSGREWPQTGPIDWNAIVRYKKKLATELDLDDLPALRRLVADFTADPEYARRFDPISPGIPGDLGRRLSESSAVILASRVMTRAECELGPDALRRAFTQLEHGALAPQLKVDVVAPLLLTSFEGSLDLGNGVAIEPLAEDFQRARAHDVSTSDINPFLAAAATHAVVLHDRSFDNADGASLLVMQSNAESLNLDLVDRVCQAIEISTGRATGYGPIYLRPHGWATDWDGDLPAIEHAMTVRRYPSSFDDRQWNRQRNVLPVPNPDALRLIYERLLSGEPRARLASDRLFQSSRRADMADILLDACIGIEALVGQGRDELVHRMSQRAAAALSAYAGAENPADPQAVYALLKKVYDQRSRLVHGGTLKSDRIAFKGQDFGSVSSVASMILRELLRAHLLAIPAWSPEDLDRMLLDALKRAE